ncbi:AraC family transcriptional regulator [Leptospira ognonensis]|uniref:AraC family transcriptional regulator n=1 Tax=Leptospira ognonensis TaxID=2484945 RepID=A0A4V3JRA5_9LEPT|nr:effector binding domain-containing protein [Leptospira ognonensis]TGL59285.1 AraC family transcriptional regulator [Leptospira ognonensis]
MSEILEPLVNTEPFTVMGLRVRTSNAAGEASVAIPSIYSRFYKEEIPKKLEVIRRFDPLFALYFNYEKDETGKYDFLLGYSVRDDEKPIHGLELVRIPPQSGRYFAIQPGAPEDVVPKFWAEIWQRKEVHTLRTFQYDWEEYSEAGIRVFLSSK